jgi:hypothetical protein
MSYPDPHYDEDDSCQCPDHRAMREAARAELTGRFVLAFLDSGVPRRQPTERDRATAGYSEETRKLIGKAIALDPALEESILKIAELAYGDGQDSI